MPQPWSEASQVTTTIWARPGFAGHEGGVERAGHQGPQAAPAESIVLEDATQERCRVVDHGRNVNRAVVVRIGLRAEEG
jgi:hypothetical protein